MSLGTSVGTQMTRAQMSWGKLSGGTNVVWAQMSVGTNDGNVGDPLIIDNDDNITSVENLCSGINKFTQLTGDLIMCTVSSLKSYLYTLNPRTTEPVN